MNIAITGANSSVGRSLLRHITDQQEIHANAGVRTQQALAGLPSSPHITPCLVNYNDTSGLSSLLTNAGCVVHLAGILLESSTSTYQRANIDTTQTVVEACRQARVDHLIFISVLGADPHSSNRYFQSKGQAEQAVKDSGISATIIRTPILLGPGTAGARSLLHVASRPSVKLLGGGHYSMHPLDVDDLSQAILNCARAQQPGVALHDLAGPQSITYRALVAEVSHRLGQKISIGSIPIWAGKLGAALQNLIRRQGMTPTVIEVITTNEVVRQNAAADLGVSLTPLSSTLDDLIHGKTQQS
tara:strand:- start:9834 stop:10736 length:903 start_codon:yes stop_codon:yes gene_type:complete